MKSITDAKSIYVEQFLNSFFSNNIPHNITNSPYYITMVDAIAEYGRGIDPPTAYEISHSYIGMEIEEMDNILKHCTISGMNMVAY